MSFLAIKVESHPGPRWCRQGKWPRRCQEPFRLGPVNTAVKVRPLTQEDIPAAQEVAHNSLREAGTHYGWEMPELDATARARGERRIRHCLAHDPESAFVADLDGEVVGVGLATVRGDQWFLSLLTVTTELQGQGAGRALLEATMGALRGPGVICASDDPKALRRYRSAGFSLHPTYEAKGPIDRSRLRRVTGVREGSYDRDRDLVEEVGSALRGAPHGPDIDYYADGGLALFVTDTPAGRGYVVCRETGPGVLGATTEEAASRLLWTALANATDQEAMVGWVTCHQQWALDVLLDAHLSVRPRGSRCLRGDLGAMAPYIPSGALG